MVPIEAGYIVVEACSAGRAMSSRLSEDFATGVPLLVAGGADHDPWIQHPSSQKQQVFSPEQSDPSSPGLTR